ncbi:sensor histidine kinase [Pseudoalteromonas denitrificans]|nr:HAMP domain-containing sensor histidine kinase [Pseudoalteromonas denitrificans]
MNIRHSISFTLAKVGVLIAFVFGVLISSYQIYSDYLNQGDSLAQTVEQILQVTESSATQAVYEYDEALAARVSNGLFAYKPISEVIISDDFGEVLAKKSRDIKRIKPWWVPEKLFGKNKKFQIDLNTRDSIDNAKARLVVIVDPYYGALAFMSRAVVILVSGIVRNIFLAFALLAVFYYLISKPLIKLINDLMQINPEYPQSELVILAKHKDSELGLLKEIINRLLQSVVDHITEVKGLNDTLELKVLERTSELDLKSKEALFSLEKLKNTELQLIEAEKNAALGGLVAGVAHEINTPLGISVTASSSLLEVTDELNTKFSSGSMKRSDFESSMLHLQDCAHIILKNSNRAADLISSFKQIAVDQTSYERRSFMFKAYIDEIVFTLRPQINKSEIKVQVECEEDFIVDSYPGAIAQVVSNLVLNALLHGYSDKDEGNIVIKIDKKGERIQLDFCDDGKGISVEHLGKIFNPFYTTNRNAGGSGLGLHIISNIVTNSLQGRITCDSELGKGCCFKLNFMASPNLDK